MNMELASLEEDSRSLLIDAVQAVTEVEAYLDWEATQRIPRALAGGQTFFGEYDYWILTAVLDDRTCYSCNVLDKITFTGLELRTAFRYLDIIGPDLILARVHPHCRCVLVRVTNPIDYIRLGSVLLD
jgi:hypothetical protein